MNLINKKQQELLPLVKAAARFGDFTLASGKKSDFYFDGRVVSCSAKGSRLMAEIILAKISGLKAVSIGGLTMGADPIAAAVAAVSAGSDEPIDCFIVRKEAKAHGTGRQVEGICPDGARVVIVDDVITTAGSTLKAIEAVEKIGCKVVMVISLVDREEGGAEALAKYDFWPIFKKSDLL
ncbi:MAG: orotate phosphoribosyltransferase [Candidatus Margulisiibacteriota bacterium]|jgi:orotate phosphoribosyltransferase